MKLFKWIDFIISLLLLGTLFAWYSNNPSIERMIECYFITGGWHIISMIIHAITRTFTRKWGRRHVYHWISFISVITLPLGSYWILALIAPFMAVFYTFLCLQEAFAMTHQKQPNPG